MRLFEAEVGGAANRFAPPRPAFTGFLPQVEKPSAQKFLKPTPPPPPPNNGGGVRVETWSFMLGTLSTVLTWPTCSIYITRNINGVYL
jgi:hypothetical protein